MKKSWAFLSVTILSFVFLGSAAATTIEFYDRTAFLSATGAVSNGAVPNLGNVGTSATIGNITFSSINNQNIYFGTGPNGLYLNGSSGRYITDWTSHLDGNDIAISGNEDLRVTILALTSPVYSFGFDFVEPTDDTTNVESEDIVNSTFQVKLMDNGTATVFDSFSFNAPDDIAYFVGAWTDFGFDRVEIIETGGIDNEFFGEFYTGTTPVPEPATMLLLASGLAGLATFRKRFRK